MAFNIDPSNYYESFKKQPYPEFFPSDTPVDESQIPKGCFRQGDVVYDQENRCIAIVLGTIDIVGGEIRLDTDGMQPTENIRLATLKDFDLCQYRTDAIHKQLLADCLAK
jgi:hypothetical protein